MAQALQATPFLPSLSFLRSNTTPRKPNSISFRTPTTTPLKNRGLKITCARVGGVEIPNNKRVQYSLQYIHGIGRTRAKQILCDLKMENKITKDLSEDELIILRREVSNYMIEGDLGIFNCSSNRFSYGLKELQSFHPIGFNQYLIKFLSSFLKI